MEKLWLNNELVDRLAMLQQTEATHPGINQVAIEKGLVGNCHVESSVPDGLS